MVTTHGVISPDATPAAHPSRIVAAATLLGWFLLAVLIASTYVGRSPGPYGVCQGRSGRPVPCELARH